MRRHIALNLESGVLACGRMVCCHGGPICRVNEDDYQHARNGDGWIKVVTNRVKGRMGWEKTRCGHVKAIWNLPCT